MRGYQQYCPIARASEVLGERWTVIIIRNMLLGCDTYTEIQKGAPGIPKSVLTQRLRRLEQLELIERVPGASPRASRYVLTDAGRGLWDVCIAMGTWGAHWLDVAPQDFDPYIALWAMSRSLVVELLPDRRVVVRFNFSGYGSKRIPAWLILDRGEGEICLKPPGFDEDLVVDADAEWFVKWHMGWVSWGDVLRQGHIRVEGARSLARALPTWNKLSKFADIKPARSDFATAST